MEASAIKQHLRVGGGVRARTPLLRMQSDERLVTLIRRGNHAAFGALVGRYEARLLAFCRHLLRSREDAEDVLQEVFASAFKAIMADDRAIRVRPWLYRIARNRCLNHLRRISAIGVDSIEDHFSEHGPSTSDMVQRREDLWQLVGDIQELPESQRSALLLREMEALSYEQIADVLDKTIPSVKSLLIRARRSLAESAEARSLSCEEARAEIDEVNAGQRERPSRVVRRHIASCHRCADLREPEPSLPALRVWLPLGPGYLLKKLWFSPLIHSARDGSTATAAGAGAAAGPSLVSASTTAAGFVSAGVGGLAGKAAVGLTAAALGLAGAVVVDTSAPRTARAGAGPAHPSDRDAVAASAPIATAHTTDTGIRRDRSPARTVRAAVPRSSPEARTTTTPKTTSTLRPAAAPKQTRPGGPQSQVVTTTLTGMGTRVTDATDATADPVPPVDSATSTTPSSTSPPIATGLGDAPVPTTTGTLPPNPNPNPNPTPIPTPTTPTRPTTSSTPATPTPTSDPPPAGSDRSAGTTDPAQTERYS